jgi:ABC-type amino acid transport substrate-binding protein
LLIYNNFQDIIFSLSIYSCSLKSFLCFLAFSKCLSIQFIFLIKDVNDLKDGLSTDAEIGTTGYTYASKLKNVKVIDVDTISTLLLMLEQRKIDSIINDDPTTKYYIKQNLIQKYKLLMHFLH